MAKRKKILVPIFNRAHYGRLRPVLKAIQENPGLELQIMVSSQLAYDNFFLNIKHSRPNSWRLALPWYLKARLLSLWSRFDSSKMIEKDFLMRNIIKDGFEIDSRVALFADGGSSDSMAKTVGFGMIKLTDELKRLKPDLVLVNADRFEMMSIALTASCLNIPIAHNEGGDRSGTIDESIRHAITKLSHLHFTSTERSRQRVIQMGENPDYVFHVGSPAIDVVKTLDVNMPANAFHGVIANGPYVLVLFHPVTTETTEKNIVMAENIMRAIEDLAIPTVFIGSNIDAKSKELGLVTKEFLKKELPFVYFIKSLYPDNFYRALANAGCALGNSSSFIREGAYFGTPVVLIGSRQHGRERDGNVREVDADVEEIKKAVVEQMNHGRYPRSSMFGDGNASIKIANLLAQIEPSIQKNFFDLWRKS